MLSLSESLGEDRDLGGELSSSIDAIRESNTMILSISPSIHLSMHSVFLVCPSLSFAFSALITFRSTPPRQTVDICCIRSRV